MVLQRNADKITINFVQVILTQQYYLRVFLDLFISTGSPLGGK